MVSLEVGFVIQYVVFYYRHSSAASFDPYWPRPGWLLLHMNGGALALLSGPWQFWTGCAERIWPLIAGRGDSSCSVSAWALSGRWVWPRQQPMAGHLRSVMALASAWLSTRGMAYLTIRGGLVELHKEWMIRAYVVTFAFVFRVLHNYGPTSHLQPEGDRAITLSWPRGWCDLR
jgi:Predicted membrane protein (DUF2306)